MTKTKFNIKSTLETLKKEELQIFKLDGNFSNVKYKIFDRIFKATSPKNKKMSFFQKISSTNQRLTQITLKIWNMQAAEINQIKYMNKKLMT